MKYSIIIPALNEEKLLPNLLKQLDNSLLKEKLEYEVIVSDGGSSDNTIRHALEHSDILKIHCEIGKQNIALGRNAGAKLAQGKILIFLNADIILDDTASFLNYIENKFAGSGYLAMTCYVKVFPTEEKFSDKFFHGIYNRYFHLLNNLGIGMGRGECQIIKKEVFEKLNGYNETLAAGEDFDLFKRIRKHGKILFAREICVFESPRRFRKLGYINVTWTWIKNGLSVLVMNRSTSKEWEQIR